MQTDKETYNTTRTTCTELRQFYKELDGKMNRQSEAQAEFWNKLWSEPVEHNRDSEWLKKVKEKLRDTPQQEITVKELKRAIARISNWKAA